MSNIHSIKTRVQRKDNPNGYFPQIHPHCLQTTRKFQIRPLIHKSTNISILFFRSPMYTNSRSPVTLIIYSSCKPWTKSKSLLHPNAQLLKPPTHGAWKKRTNNWTRHWDYLSGKQSHESPGWQPVKGAVNRRTDFWRICFAAFP